MSDYQPLNCEFHDIIEVCATLRKPVRLFINHTDETQSTLHTVITDVFAQDGAEYLKTQCGELVSLDSLLAIDGHDTRNSAGHFY
jgi:Rho-binding antiterminator